MPAKKKATPPKKTKAPADIRRGKSKTPAPPAEKAKKTAEFLQYKTTKSFSVVGIGASAGGLEAFTQFISSMPTDTGLAFVLVSHLDPSHKGIMPELVQRTTKMKVMQVKDGMKVQPNCVYVIPPNKVMSILRGRLLLLDPVVPRGLRLPIDSFLRDLAADQQEQSIGVILSGMGTDGTLGVRAIKEKMGLVMVQSTESAKYDSMPRSAIDTGVADYIAPPEELAARLISFIRHAPAVPKQKRILEEKTLSSLSRIMILLREHTRHDFSSYKKNTIYRRVERRMGIHQIDNISHYVRFLQENPAEIQLLFKELLIGVTSFFRDAAAFEALKEKVLPAVLKKKPGGKIFRVWVAGCSTGEEAYSIAMVLKEVLAEQNPKAGAKIQVFATDLDNDAIEKARRGIYPDNIAADVDPARLKRFFIKEDSGYRIKKEIRDLIIFAQQNILQDPPFTKLDMVSCRNLLIYLSSEMQHKLLPVLHYVLNPGGVLFLGSSETVGGFTSLFSPFDLKWRLFERQDTAAVMTGLTDFQGKFMPVDIEPPDMNGTHKPLNDQSLQNCIENVLLQELGVAAVLINADGDILYIHGKTGKYLEPASGRAAMNIFVMAREGLGYELSYAVKQVLKQKTAQTLKGLKIKTNGGHKFADVTIQPLTVPKQLDGFLLVTFREVEMPDQQVRLGKAAAPSPAARSVKNMELLKELELTRDHLQTIMEQKQTSEEELKSINEELQSNNEELQSTNEELTTSREEMQSLNEELMSVNNELQTKIEELTELNNDMKNLLNSTEIATLFLDNDLNIRRFTNQTIRVMKLLPSDAGRPFTDIVTHLLYDDLERDVREVLETLIFKEKQVMSKDGSWFLMRVIPYRTVTNVIDGVVVTFIDITAAKHMEESLRGSEDQLAAVIETIPSAISIIDINGRVTFANNAAKQLFELLCRTIPAPARDAAAWNITTPEGKIVSGEGFPFKQIIGTGEAVKNVRYAVEQAGRTKGVTLSINAAPLRDARGAVSGVAASIVELEE